VIHEVYAAFAVELVDGDDMCAPQPVKGGVELDLHAFTEFDEAFIHKGRRTVKATFVLQYFCE
jgi:hypothetical protein